MCLTWFPDLALQKYWNYTVPNVDFTLGFTMCIDREHKRSIKKIVLYTFCDNILLPVCALGSILKMLRRKINEK